MIRVLQAVILSLVLLLSGCLKVHNKPTEQAEDRSPDNRESLQEVDILFFDNPPHIYIDEKGNPAGAVYDFIEEGIAPEMGIKFNWSRESTSIPRQIEDIQNTRDTVCALLIYSEERAKIMAFSETPFFSEPSGLAVLSSNPIEAISSVEDLKGMTVGYAIGGYLTPFMRDDSIVFDLLSNSNYHRVNLERLNLGRIDAVYAPGKSSLAYNIRAMGLKDEIKLLELPEPFNSYYVVFSKKAPDLVRKYDEAFKKINGKQFYLKKLEPYTGSY